MGSEDSGYRSVLNSGMKIFKSPNGVDSFYGSNNWDPIVSLSQGGGFVNNFVNPHCPLVLENQTVESSSHLVHFSSNSSLVDMVPKISSFASSFGCIAESGCHSSFALKNGIGNQKALTNIEDSNGRDSEDGILGPSPSGKRKRTLSVGASTKNDVEQKKDHKSELPKEEEKKQKPEQNIGLNPCSKPEVKQGKEYPIGAEPSKEDYIHLRAKRGQATNSHSLAERVRREKISERMRLLQELVPGCNKITGKAIMLDEIINYVQSLQQQVEFLSMKLATVNPVLNVDIDKILSKDIFHPSGSNPTSLDSSHPPLFLRDGNVNRKPLPGYPQGTFNGTTPPFCPSPQQLWSNELQGILQMGFDLDLSVSSLGHIGSSIMEL